MYFVKEVFGFFGEKRVDVPDVVGVGYVACSGFYKSRECDL